MTTTENRPIEIRSYEKVWKVDHRIYSVGNVNLPVPVNLTSLFYFGMGLIFSLILCRLPLLHNIPAAFKFLLIPLGVMYVLRNVTLDGKNPIWFFFGMARYVLMEKGQYFTGFREYRLKQKPEKIHWVTRTLVKKQKKTLRIRWTIQRG